MSIMTQTSDGFVIAEEDLKMRGPGDMYGTRQSGALDFKIADIVQDAAIVEATKAAAEQLLTNDPQLSAPDNRLLYLALHQTQKGQPMPWSKIS